jgi:hypothetical protein
MMKRHLWILALLSGVLVGATDRASAACVDLALSQSTKAHCTIAAGGIVEAVLSDLRPTQPSLGFDELHYRLGRFEFGKDKLNKRFDDWCESSGLGGAESASAQSRLVDPSSFTCKVKQGSETKASLEPMKTAVVGPKGQLYLTDGHHTLTSFMEAKDGGPQTIVRLRVTHNFGDLDEAAFWAAMKKNRLVWLRDSEDREISPAQLPQSLGMKNFGNDKYRSIFYFGRDIGYKQLSDNAAFQEFYYGSWLRKHPTLKIDQYKIDTLDGYLTLLKDVTRALSILPDEAVVSDGVTAKELGRMAQWNGGAPETGGEFGKQSVPYSDEKPGKLAYAFRYKEAHGLK